MALTFDDGPEEPWTSQILAIMADFSARASFFVLGSAAQRRPGLLERMVSEGHTVAVHAWDHLRLPDLPAAECLRQLETTAALVEGVTGRRPRLARPPYGEFDDAVLAQFDRLRLRPVFWSAHAWDWTRPGKAAIVETAASGLEAGAIVLLHDGGGDRSQTVAAVADLLRFIAAKGWRATALPNE